jgi:uncharacterized protein YqhQ
MATQLNKNGGEIIYESVLLDLVNETLETLRRINGNLETIANNTEVKTSSKGGK